MCAAREQRAIEGTQAGVLRRARAGSADGAAARGSSSRAWSQLRYYRRFLDEVSRHRRGDSASKPHGPPSKIFDPKAPPTPIGIDLGTTNSLVAYVTPTGRPRPCGLRPRGARALASCTTARTARSSSGGTRSRSRRASREDTIVSVKRFMGRGADDPETRRLGPYASRRTNGPTWCASTWPSAVVTPVEVSAEILARLREHAEDELRTSAAR